MVEDDPDRRRLTIKKVNNARPGAEFTVRWVGGVFVRETPSGVTAGPLGGLGAVIEAELTFLEMVNRYNAEGRPVGAVPSSNFAPAIFARDPRAKGIGRHAFAAAMNKLFEAGKITVAEYGPPSKRRNKLVVAMTAEEE
jgi:hypothetical protein